MTEPRAVPGKLLDFILLIVAALAICAVLVGAFIFAKIRHVNPMWVFLSMISIGFLAAIGEDYRNQFRSPRFVLFSLGWLVVNIIVVVTILGSFGWFLLIPALLLEQALFSLSAHWIFGIAPLGRRRT